MRDWLLETSNTILRSCSLERHHYACSTEHHVQFVFSKKIWNIWFHVILLLCLYLYFCSFFCKLSLSKSAFRSENDIFMAVLFLLSSAYSSSHHILWHTAIFLVVNMFCDMFGIFMTSFTFWEIMEIISKMECCLKCLK